MPKQCVSAPISILMKRMADAETMCFGAGIYIYNFLERSRSGRARGSGVPVTRKGSRVRIPPSPPVKKWGTEKGEDLKRQENRKVPYFPYIEDTKKLSK